MIGLIFPIAAILICYFALSPEGTNNSLVALHHNFPLLWIIDTAPIVLGLISYQVGNRVNKSNSSYLKEIEDMYAKQVEQNDRLQELNKEKVVLLQEVHHRVKNNMQIIISLLKLQMNDVESNETRSHFEDAVNRILAISTIHGKLYQEDLVSKVQVKPYFEELASNLLDMSNFGEKIDLKVNSSVDFVGLNTVMPLGLIINELLTNSIKYAFEQSQKGKIEIELKQEKENELSLQYSDDGTWIEQSENGKHFGLDLIEILTSQMNGKVDRKTGENGTKYQFTIHNLD